MQIVDQALELPPQIQWRHKNKLPDPPPPARAISSILPPEEEPAFLDRLNLVDHTRHVLQDVWT